MGSHMAAFLRYRRQAAMRCLKSLDVEEPDTLPSSTQIERFGGPWTLLSTLKHAKIIK